MLKTAILPLLALIAYSQSGAEIIQGQAVSWTDFSHITCITIGHDFTYFGTTEGILRYDRFEDRWYEPLTVSDGIRGHIIHRLSVSPNDIRIVVETEEGIYSFDRDLGQWFLEMDFPLEYFQNSQPELPLPAMLMPFGFQMSPEGFISDDEFRDYRITAKLDDFYNDNLYLGSWGRGVIKADYASLMAELIPYGLLQKQTDAIFIDGDSIWLAGNAGDRLPEYAETRYGVSLYDRSAEEFTYFEPRYIHGFDSEIIYDIAGDDKKIYFAGRHGLTVLNRKDGNVFTLNRHDGFPGEEATALATGADSIWIGTSEGLVLYTPSVDTMVVVGRSSLGKRFITCLKLTDDRLIIGTDKGAYYIDFTDMTIGRLKDPEGNLGGMIRHISVNGNELLISSEWGVTSIDLETGKSEPVPYIDVARGAYAAVGNRRYIAAVVDDGLLLIERKSGKRREFTEDDGLLSTRINAMVVEGDYLWLGSEEGLTRFQWVNPDRVD
jgi:hypothetical protein